MSEHRVRPRDVWTVLWVTTVFLAGLYFTWSVRRILMWILVAAFFGVVLNPPVRFLVERGVKRGLAVAIVMLTLFAVGGGLTYAFVRPIVQESVSFAENLPQNVDRIRHAPGVRQILHRFNIENRVEQVSKDLPRRLIGLSGPILSAFKSAAEVTVALITIVVLTVFLLLYGPGFAAIGLGLLGNPRRQERIERVGAESVRSVSGWVAGNVITSVIAAVASMVAFLILGLPYGVLLGLWVGVADLIPLIGATLGALPAVIVAFLHSTTAGIVVLVFFLVYQQFENHVLQPAVYGRTIKLNPFVVLVAVLIGVELAGFLGALLALPIAGTVQIVIGEVMDYRRERMLTPTEVAGPLERPLEVAPHSG
jgi:predicted PurR-regulated permease PerM